MNDDARLNTTNARWIARTYDGTANDDGTVTFHQRDGSQTANVGDWVTRPVPGHNVINVLTDTDYRNTRP